MKQDYFIVVLAHSLHGRLRRVHISHKLIYAVMVFAVVGFLSMCGFAMSYARMVWKVANYNSLRNEAESMRTRYQALQKTVNQTNEQLATLQMFASEVSVAYGVKDKLTGSPDLASEARLTPTVNESIDQFRFLQSFGSSRGANSWLQQSGMANTVPGIWPVSGKLTAGFGQRADPFSGEEAWHRGVDISAPTGTAVQAAGDGIVVHAGPYAGYGRVVIISHTKGYETYYGHLSKVFVLEGQTIRHGSVLGAVGTSGRSTGPHLHYEVRVNHVPVNPYRFLSKSPITETAHNNFPF